MLCMLCLCYSMLYGGRHKDEHKLTIIVIIIIGRVARNVMIDIIIITHTCIVVFPAQFVCALVWTGEQSFSSLSRPAPDSISVSLSLQLQSLSLSSPSSPLSLPPTRFPLLCLSPSCVHRCYSIHSIRFACFGRLVPRVLRSNHYLPTYLTTYLPSYLPTYSPVLQRPPATGESAPFTCNSHPHEQSPR
jgi:hypothetical protein